MSGRALLRGATDLLVVGMGALALADGVHAVGLLQPAAVLFTVTWVGALLARHRWSWSPALVPIVLVTHGVALQGWPNDSGVTMAALMLSALLFGVANPTGRVLGAAPLWPGAIGALMLVSDYGESGLSDLFYPATYGFVLLGVGVVVGHSARSGAAARTRAEDAHRELEQQRESIVTQERARIAADLRGLVADQVLRIRHRAGTARVQLAHGNVAGAEESLLRIEEAGRETLTDLRHMLGLLRRDMTEDALAPQPGLAAIEAAVADARRQGVAVTLTFEGISGNLPRGTEIVVYRVFERVLDQACRAGVDVVEVRIHESPSSVGVTIRAHNLGSLLRADQLAIRERVRLYGGEMLIGTDEQDRDILKVELPVLSVGPAVTT